MSGHLGLQIFRPFHRGLSIKLNTAVKQMYSGLISIANGYHHKTRVCLRNKAAKNTNKKSINHLVSTISAKYFANCGKKQDKEAKTTNKEFSAKTVLPRKKLNPLRFE